MHRQEMTQKIAALVTVSNNMGLNMTISAMLEEMLGNIFRQGVNTLGDSEDDNL